MELDALAKKAAEGDENAFHMLVDGLSAPLYRSALALCGSVHDAEDALQETFIAAYGAISRFRGESSCKTWLTAILIRQAAKVWGRRSRTEATPGELSDPASGRAAEKAGEGMDIASALAILPEPLREAIVLREVQGLSYAEISTTLGIPPGTVESRLFRAREQLRKSLSDYEWSVI